MMLNERDGQVLNIKPVGELSKGERSANDEDLVDISGIEKLLGNETVEDEVVEQLTEKYLDMYRKAFEELAD